MAGQNSKSLPEMGLGALLMFIIGFAGFSVLAAVVMVILIALGILPAI